MKTIISLLLILAISTILNCKTEKHNTHNGVAIMSGIINSTLDSIKKTVYFINEETDSIFILVNNPLYVFNYNGNVIEVDSRNIVLNDQRARTIESDTIFTNLSLEEAVGKKLKLTNFYFVEFDSIFINRNNLKANVNFGPLGWRNYNYYFYNKDSFKIDSSKSIARIIK